LCSAIVGNGSSFASGLFPESRKGVELPNRKGRFVAGAASFKFFKKCGILAWMWLFPLSQSLSDAAEEIPDW
jgi:hypothetical protein